MRTRRLSHHVRVRARSQMRCEPSKCVALLHQQLLTHFAGPGRHKQGHSAQSLPRSAGPWRAGLQRASSTAVSWRCKLAADAIAARPLLQHQDVHRWAIAQIADEVHNERPASCVQQMAALAASIVLATSTAGMSPRCNGTLRGIWPIVVVAWWGSGHARTCTVVCTLCIHTVVAVVCAAAPQLPLWGRCKC